MRVPRKAKPHAGRRGASRNAPARNSRSRTDTTPHPNPTLYLAWVATDAASQELDDYASRTDAPPLGIVEAADALDLARQPLAGYLNQGVLP